MKHKDTLQAATTLPIPGTTLAAALWQSQLERPLDRLTPHLTHIVQRHVHRIGRSRWAVSLRGILRDCLEDVRPGAANSWLADKSAEEVELLCDLLLRELIASIEDAADGTALEAARQVASMMSMWSHQDRAHNLLRWWTRRCRQAGVSETTFLYTLM